MLHTLQPASGQAGQTAPNHFPHCNRTIHHHNNPSSTTSRTSPFVTMSSTTHLRLLPICDPKSFSHLDSCHNILTLGCWFSASAELLIGWIIKHHQRPDLQIPDSHGSDSSVGIDTEPFSELFRHELDVFVIPYVELLSKLWHGSLKIFIKAIFDASRKGKKFGSIMGTITKKINAGLSMFSSLQ